ncbi:MAG TPA: hypothetical protein VK894_08680 [Jiangellales bacterium]|nr:hypothetical protein [Jiangellales bacterium]
MDRVRAVADWWFRDPATGRRVLGQAPNPAIGVAVGATLVRVLGVLPASADEPLRWIGTGAWLVWGLDELLRGASPFRRTLGAAVLTWQLAGLVR